MRARLASLLAMLAGCTGTGGSSTLEPAPAAPTAATHAAVAPQLETFDFAGVTVDGGLLKAQLDEVREYYLRIPNDDLLKGFRERAGRPAPGVALGGWYSADVFHVFGQIVSGLARLHAATGDVRCRDKVRTLVAGFGECIADDGWFFASQKPNAPHYIFDKVAGGLLDAHRYCADPQALTLLARVAAWGERHLARDRKTGDTSTEWYTLSENLYRAWLATGEARYRDFAKVWEYREWWDLLRERRDPFAQPPRHGWHAYSHLNTLGGAARAYEATGDARYLEAAVAGHDAILGSQAFATGGFGPDERLLPAAELAERLALTHASAETQCGAWAVFKLCKQLLRMTGEARYADWPERQLYNAIAATLPASPDGRVFYYSDYCATGGTKVLHPEPWTCCSGTRPQAVAEAVDLIWARHGEDLCLSLFVPSTVRFAPHGTPVTVSLRTEFPAGERVELRVVAKASVTFALRVRVPPWLAATPEVRVGGAPARTTVDARRWLVLEREWHDGDRVELRLPVRPWSQPLRAGSAYPAALLAGPVVLAVRTTGRTPHGAIDVTRLAETLVPCEGEPLTFRVAGAPELLVRPFYAFGAGQPYFAYLDPALANRVSHRDVAFHGAWGDAGRFRFSEQHDASAEYAFEGTGIRWLGWRFDDAGIAEVTIDGGALVRVDQFGPGRDLPFSWEALGLARGRHVLRIRLTGERGAASKGCFLNVAGFEVVVGT